MQQRLTSDVVHQVIESYERLVNILAFSAKAYWVMWGPWGQPLIEGVDRWAEKQRVYLQSARGAFVSQPASPARLPMPLLSP
jgi:hypothetical protein